MASLLTCAALLGVAGCSAEVVPASGRVFLYPRPANEGELAFGTSYTSARLTLVGLETQALEKAEDMANIEWSVEGGRYGNTKEQIAIVALYKDSKIVTAAKVRFIVPWSGAKRLEVLVPKSCGTALVPGSGDCDLEKLPEEWFDVTALEDYRAP